MTMRTSPISPAFLQVDEDAAARVALACAGVSGEVSVHVGIQSLGSAAALVAAVHDDQDAAAPLSGQVRRRIRSLATGDRVARVLRETARCGLAILTPQCELWPTQIEALRGLAPQLLWVQGDPRILQEPSVAITGTASPTSYGIHMGIELATGLAGRGWAVAAGTGPGVEQIVLRSADAMSGRSITVAAASLDKVRSSSHMGVAVSELPPTAQLTLRAQRRSKHLLAALASKTIVVEATLSSSSLRTAEAAHALDRPVGVVPGPTASSKSAGCYWLAQEHQVSLVTSITDADHLR